MNNINQVVNEVREARLNITDGTWVSDDIGTITVQHTGFVVAQVFEDGDAHFVAKSPFYVESLLSAYEEAQREIERLNSIQETMKEAVSAIVSEGRREKLKSDEWTEAVVNEARQLRTEHTAMKEALKKIGAVICYESDSRACREVVRIANDTLFDLSQKEDSQ